MTKPRIFIAMHYMEIGGAESSLIGLLEALDPEKVDVDLFVFAHHGLFMRAIPSHVNLLSEDVSYSLLEEPIVTIFKRGYLHIGIARLLAKWKTNRYYRLHPEEKDNSVGFAYIGKEVGKVLPSLKRYGEYNLAISYNYPHNIVLDKVTAKKKIAWLHTDYRNISVNKDLELPIWSGYDLIVSISPDVTKGFLNVFPSLADRIIEVENILPKDYILSKAEDSIGSRAESLEYGKPGILTLCSIGRISYAKNYDNVPYMARELKTLFELKDDNFKFGDFRWYIVGPGDHSDIDALSKELGVEEKVLFLGPSNNPYPFIKNCDIYVHPSRFEGKSIVVREAQVLCKPVIITNYPTSKSQINNGVDGVICEQDNRKIAEAIYGLASNEIMRAKIVNNLQTQDNAGVDEVQKIYKLL